MKSNRNFLISHTAPIVRRSRYDEVTKLEIGIEKSIAKRKTGQYIQVLGLRFLEILWEEEYPFLGKNGVGIEVFEVS